MGMDIVISRNTSYESNEYIMVWARMKDLASDLKKGMLD